LLFLGFALAVHLCNLRLQGKTLPNVLPATITNGFSSIVDIIFFGVPDIKPPIPTGIPLFDMSQLTAQPTAMPGQWGYVTAPAVGLPDILLLESRMLPQAGRESTTTGLQGNAQIPWGVTK